MLDGKTAPSLLCCRLLPIMCLPRKWVVGWHQEMNWALPILHKHALFYQLEHRPVILLVEVIMKSAFKMNSKKTWTQITAKAWFVSCSTFNLDIFEGRGNWPHSFYYIHEWAQNKQTPFGYQNYFCLTCAL